MKSIFSLESATKKAAFIIAFLPVISLVYPEITLASSLQPQGQASFTFEISPNKNEELVAKTKIQQLIYADLLAQESVKNEILAQKVQTYLEQYDSPLAPYAREIVTLPQWQRALAITYQESKFCKHAKNYNCGSIGVKPGHKLWRQYNNAYEGLRDVSALMERPIYKERFTNCKAMMGVYVVPGSANWLNSCNKHSNAFVQMTTDSEAEHLALIQANTTVTALAIK
jgi:hypothetical protein